MQNAKFIRWEGNIIMKKFAQLVCTTALILATMVGCGNSSDDSSGGSGDETQETIKIAFVGPLTGESSASPLKGLNGALLAAQQCNEEGGILGGRMIEIVSFDDRKNVDEACAIADKISADPSIVGVSYAQANSTLALATGPIYQENGVPAVTVMASHPDVAEIGKFEMRNNTTDYFESLNSVQIAYNSGYRKIFYVGAETDYGVSCSVQTEQATQMVVDQAGQDMALIGSVTYLTGTVDYAAEIAQVMASDADVILLSSGYEQDAPFIKQLRKAGCDLPVIVHGNCYDPMFAEIGGEVVEGVLMPTLFDVTSTNPKVVKFVKEYNDVYGEDPNFVSALTYDSTWQMIKAIEAAGTTDREAVCDKMYEVEFDGVTGVIIYDENHECIAPQVAVKVENGQLVEAKDLIYPSWEEFIAAIKK